MSVRLTPCFGCPLRKGCELRAGWQKKVSGLGLSAAKFSCPKLAEGMRLGRRIIIRIPVAEDWRGGEDGEWRFADKLVKATIVTADAHNHNFSCVVDRGQLSEAETQAARDANLIRFRKRMKHTRIAAFIDDELDLMVCRNNAPLWPTLPGRGCDTSSGGCLCTELSHG